MFHNKVLVVACISVVVVLITFVITTTDASSPRQQPNIVVILAGSIKDQPFVDKIMGELKKINIYARNYVASAHKNTKNLLYSIT